LDYFDIVLAADVFVYIGDLSLIFSMLKTSIRHNGIFAFTVEDQNDNAEYILQTTGRYAHSVNYITQLCQQFGFTIKANDAITPRWQAGTPIAGRLFVLVKNE